MAIQHLRGTDAQFTAGNPVLENGQIGYVTDAGYFKFGNGLDHWLDIAERFEAADVGGGASNFYKGVDYAIFYSDLPAFTYDNGTDGVGATITANANGALEAVGGDTPSTGERVVVLSSDGDAEAGIYDVTEAGDGSTPFVLTRSTDCDTSEKIVQGATVAIKNGDRFGQCFASVYSSSNPEVGIDGISIRAARTDSMLESVVAGSGISVDDSDPANPIISLGAVPSYTFAELPASPALGNLAVVTDSPVNAWGDVVSSGGDAQTALIWYNGAEWSVIGGVPVI